MSKEERYNIKQTVYLNRTLDNSIRELSKRMDIGFNAAVRYLLEKALKDEI